MKFLHWSLYHFLQCYYRLILLLFKADNDEEDVGETKSQQEADPDEEDPDEDKEPEQQFHDRSLKAEKGAVVQNVNDEKPKEV